MKIVFMGTPDFAVGALDALVRAGYEVAAVVTQPDKPKGRGKGVQCPPVKEFALQHGIPVLQPVKIRDPEAMAELSGYGADLFVVAAFGQILTQEILDMPRFGCVNIHASLLPKYRGAAPIQRAILDGETVTGVTLQQMNAGIDTGDILASVCVDIAPEDTGDSLFEKLMHAGAALLIETLPRIEAGEITPEAQDETQATYAKRLSKELGQIDWGESAKIIERKIRAFHSWPGAYTTLSGKPFKLWGARISDAPADGEAGSVSAVTKEEIIVNCGEGRLVLTEVQLSGKKRMPVKDFLLGVKVQIGERLGE
ncbi:MAG: methionyl-tRNA formyltransferase [Lachnospiraceae bacterium]|nr:methionyl-tRNA formyltransferase [Lachnospiraceae bacterium]